MSWQDLFTKKRILLISIAIILTVSLAEIYVNSPSILFWLNPNNSISITNVTYPSETYRSQDLPITVYLANLGDSKDVLLEVISKDNSVLSNNIWLGAPSSTTNTTILLPVKTAGDQAFSLKVSWIGPGGFWKLEQASTDRPFKVLSADYDTFSPTKIASRAQGFDWALTVTNIGNTPADLTIELYKKDPLILSDTSGGTKQISNIQIGETRSVGFHFDVPHDASLGDHTIAVSFVTTYPGAISFKDCKETTYHDYTVTIQESPIKTQIDSAGYLLAAVLALGGGGAAITIIMGKRRR